MDVRVNRVASLGPIFAGGIHQLCYNDWVVVPKPDMKRTVALRRLVLAATFDERNNFDGNLGYDLAIYRTPRLPPSEGDIDLALESDAAREYLGTGWPPAESGRPGLRLPREGAAIYLGPSSARPGAPGPSPIELDIESAETPPVFPIRVRLDGERLDGTLATRGARATWTSDVIPADRLEQKVFEVKLAPHGDHEMRVLRLAMGRESGRLAAVVRK
jgi:hypothetical protein